MTKYKILHLPTSEYLYRFIEGSTFSLYTKKEASLRSLDCFTSFFKSKKEAKSYIDYCIMGMEFDFDDFAICFLLKEHIEIIKVSKDEI